MVQQILLTLPIYPKGFHLVTENILERLPNLPKAGMLQVFIQHTSAGLAINENANKTVRTDMDKSFDYIVPENQNFYEHTFEGPDDMPAHVKTVMTGASLSIPVSEGQLALGTWQGIYLCEFRKEAPPRNLVLTLIS